MWGYGLGQQLIFVVPQGPSPGVRLTSSAARTSATAGSATGQDALLEIVRRAPPG